LFGSELGGRMHLSEAADDLHQRLDRDPWKIASPTPGLSLPRTQGGQGW